MQKVVALVLCLSLIVSTQAFILGNDNLSGLMFYNMMTGRQPLDFNIFGGGSQPARQPANTATNTGTGSAARTNTVQQRPRGAFPSLLTLAMLEGNLGF